MYKFRSQLVHKSFREYVSILYWDPRMLIFIQNKRVQTRRLEYSLYLPRRYTHSSQMFKTIANEKRKEAEKDLLNARLALNESSSQYL